MTTDRELLEAQIDAEHARAQRDAALAVLSVIAMGAERNPDVLIMLAKSEVEKQLGADLEITQ